MVQLVWSLILEGWGGLHFSLFWVRDAWDSTVGPTNWLYYSFKINAITYSDKFLDFTLIGKDPVVTLNTWWIAWLMHMINNGKILHIYDITNHVLTSTVWPFHIKVNLRIYQYRDEMHFELFELLLSSVHPIAIRDSDKGIRTQKVISFLHKSLPHKCVLQVYLKNNYCEL